MADKGPMLGGAALKLQPRLRMFANASTAVNLVRAEQNPSVAVDPRTASDDLMARILPRTELRVTADLADLPRGSVDRVEPGVLTSVFIQMTPGEDTSGRFAGETARRGDLAIANLPIEELQSTAGRREVSWIEAGEALRRPRPRIEAGSPAAPSSSIRAVPHPETHGNGARTLVGIIDVQGFDFAHPEFLDANGTTRFLRIWDQGGDNRPNPHNRSGAPFGDEYGYGSELLKADLDAAIAASVAAKLPATELEPQSTMDPGSHGTHVASIAAGNLGVAREAPIAAVLIALSKEEAEDRRATFTDSTRIAHAVDYLVEVGRSMGLPVSINISLGTNGHAHDGSSPISRWIDAVLSQPGRCVCVAAGNAGQEAGRTPDDIGWIMGRIHSSGRVPSAGIDVLIDWVVAGNGLIDLSENELELWYGPQDRFAVSLQAPDGTTFGPLEPGEFIENQQLPDGSFVSIYNELYHPANGANYIACYLSPYFGTDRTAGIGAGTWKVRLRGLDVRDGRFHAWVERDDPVRIGRIGAREAWNFPSFFSERSNVDDTSVSSLSCGQSTISVANLDEAAERIDITSSQGPTRDGRSKPDVAAPGTGIVAARGFGDPSDRWIAMSGTSMASPYVTGVVALMLSVEPTLTAAQIAGILHRTSRPLPAGSYAWVNDAGYGRIDAAACVAEAAIVNRHVDRTA